MKKLETEATMKEYPTGSCMDFGAALESKESNKNYNAKTDSYREKCNEKNDGVDIMSYKHEGCKDWVGAFKSLGWKQCDRVNENTWKQYVYIGKYGYSLAKMVTVSTL